jgi:hypothetical protein
MHKYYRREKSVIVKKWQNVIALKYWISIYLLAQFVRFGYYAELGLFIVREKIITDPNTMSENGGIEAENTINRQRPK